MERAVRSVRWEFKRTQISVRDEDGPPSVGPGLLPFLAARAGAQALAPVLLVVEEDGDIDVFFVGVSGDPEGEVQVHGGILQGRKGGREGGRERKNDEGGCIDT